MILRKTHLNKNTRLIFLLAGTLVMIVVMTINGATLKTPATPKGILDLEFAYNASKASSVTTAWKGVVPIDNLFVAKMNTWLDFLFIFFYSFLLFNTCKLLAASFNGILLGTGRWLAKGSLAAGLFDVLENAGMLITLQGNISDSFTMLTFIFSIIKWMMVIATLVYILLAGVLLLYKRRR